MPPLLPCSRFSQDRLGLQREAVYLSGMSHPPGDVGQGEEGEMWGAGQEHAPPADPVQQMWFRVLQGYVIMIRCADWWPPCTAW